MKAHVINLARSPERRAHMLRELRKVGIEYEFVEGVDGRDVDLSDTSLVSPTWQGRSPFLVGAVGCALSHQKVWGKVLQDGAERALILEDDVILPADMNALVEAVAMRTEGAEAVLLHYFGGSRPEQRLQLRGSSQLSPSRVLALPTDIGRLGGTGAYILTRDACQRMAKIMLPIRFPADDWAFFCNEGAIDRLHCVAPMPVRINTGFRSTIGHYGTSTFQTRLREAVIKVPLVSHALTIRRQRIIGRMTHVELVDD